MYSACCLPFSDLICKSISLSTNTNDMEGKLKDLVSIVVPVYNASAYLDDCISSVVHQSYRNIEIVIVDDGSDDNSLEICQKWAQQDQRIILIHKENGGVSSARNKALSIAKGDYYVFLDSDDFLELDYVKEMLLLVKSTNTNVGICETRIFDEKHSIITSGYSNKLISNREAIAKFFAHQSWFCVIWGKIFSRKVLFDDDEPILFNESFVVGEDLLWLMQIMTQKTQFNVSCINRPLYNYRRFSEHASLSNFRGRGYVTKRYSLINACNEVCTIFKTANFIEEYRLIANEMVKYIVNGSIVIYSIDGYPAYRDFRNYTKKFLKNSFFIKKIDNIPKLKLKIVDVILSFRIPRVLIVKLLGINERRRKKKLLL